MVSCQTPLRTSGRYLVLGTSFFVSCRLEGQRQPWILFFNFSDLASGTLFGGLLLDAESTSPASGAMPRQEHRRPTIVVGCDSILAFDWLSSISETQFWSSRSMNSSVARRWGPSLGVLAGSIHILAIPNCVAVDV